MARVLSFRDRALQSRDAVELLAEKWRIPILHLLRDGPLRTGELQNALLEISPKVLTQTLRSMERDGLIWRRVHSAVPPHVEYSLTTMGESLLEPLRELCHWAKAHTAERDEARARYDRLAKDREVQTHRAVRHAPQGA
jgi:DNA-binding HxlR family transcriptional regulator